MVTPMRFGLWALALLVLAPSLDAALLSIDIGSDTIKVAVVSRPTSKPEIVLDGEANRKLPAIVAFREKGEMVLGGAAVPLLAMYPKDTLTLFNQLVGLPYGHSRASYIKDDLYIPYNFKNSTRGTIDIKLGAVKYTPEEILSVLLDHVKTLVKKHLDDPKVTVSECILVVPAYFSIPQRIAVTKAAKLAGLKPIAIQHRTTAAAVQYANGLAVSTDKGIHNLVVIDMGAFSTEVGVYRIQLTQGKATLGSVKAKTITWHSTLGGRRWDASLLRHILETFGNETNIPWEDDGSIEAWRSLRRLAKECTALKEKLSANTLLPLKLEDWYQGKDLFVECSRDLLEELTKPLTDTLVKTVVSAIDQAKVNKANLKGVSILGGGIRVPVIQERLRQLFGRDLDRTMNSDEASVMGAALHGATLVEMEETVRVGREKRTRKMKRKGFTVDDAFARTILTYTAHKSSTTPAQAPTHSLLVDHTNKKQFISLKSMEDMIVTIWDGCHVNASASTECQPVAGTGTGTTKKVPTDMAWPIKQYHITNANPFFAQMKKEHGADGTGIIELHMKYDPITSDVSVERTVAHYKPKPKPSSAKKSTNTKDTKKGTKSTAKKTDKKPPKGLLTATLERLVPKPLEGAAHKKVVDRIKDIRSSTQAHQDRASAKNDFAALLISIQREWVGVPDDGTAEDHDITPTMRDEALDRVEVEEAWMEEAEEMHVTATEYRARLRMLKSDVQEWKETRAANRRARRMSEAAPHNEDEDGNLQAVAETMDEDERAIDARTEDESDKSVGLDTDKMVDTDADAKDTVDGEDVTDSDHDAASGEVVAGSDHDAAAGEGVSGSDDGNDDSAEGAVDADADEEIDGLDWGIGQDEGSEDAQGGHDSSEF